MTLPFLRPGQSITPDAEDNWTSFLHSQRPFVEVMYSLYEKSATQPDFVFGEGSVDTTFFAYGGDAGSLKAYDLYRPDLPVESTNPPQQQYGYTRLIGGEHPYFVETRWVRGEEDGYTVDNRPPIPQTVGFIRYMQAAIMQMVKPTERSVAFDTIPDYRQERWWYKFMTTTAGTGAFLNPTNIAGSTNPLADHPMGIELLYKERLLHEEDAPSSGQYFFRRARDYEQDGASIKVSFEEGYCQSGDIMGPWIFNDIQYALSALRFCSYSDLLMSDKPFGTSLTRVSLLVAPIDDLNSGAEEQTWPALSSEEYVSSRYTNWNLYPETAPYINDYDGSRIGMDYQEREEQGFLNNPSQSSLTYFPALFANISGIFKYDYPDEDRPDPDTTEFLDSMLFVIDYDKADPDSDFPLTFASKSEITFPKFSFKTNRGPLFIGYKDGIINDVGSTVSIDTVAGGSADDLIQSFIDNDNRTITIEWTPEFVNSSSAPITGVKISAIVLPRWAFSTNSKEYTDYISPREIQIIY